jgi:hypothetical protein
MLTVSGQKVIIETLSGNRPSATESTDLMLTAGVTLNGQKMSIESRSRNSKLPTWHAGQKFANSTLEWLQPDTEESFKKLNRNPIHQQYFQEKGWDVPGAITYKFNNHGFRCDDFDDKPCLVTLGCSYTLGLGLPQSDIWPTLVGSELILKVVNLAWNGYSADSCFRLAEYWLPRLNPALVVMLAPPVDRIEVLTQKEHMVYMPTNLPPTASDAFITEWMLNSENSRLNSVKNKLALQQLCRTINVPCQLYDANVYMADSREKLEYARDYMHAGPRGHEILAERILNDRTTNK